MVTPIRRNRTRKRRKLQQSIFVSIPPLETPSGTGQSLKNRLRNNAVSLRICGPLTRESHRGFIVTAVLGNWLELLSLVSWGLVYFVVTKQTKHTSYWKLAFRLYWSDSTTRTRVLPKDTCPRAGKCKICPVPVSQWPAQGTGTGNLFLCHSHQ